MKLAKKEIEVCSKTTGKLHRSHTIIEFPSSSTATKNPRTILRISVITGVV